MAGVGESVTSAPPNVLFATPDSSTCKRGPYKRQGRSSCRKIRWSVNKKAKLLPEDNTDFTHDDESQILQYDVMCENNGNWAHPYEDSPETLEENNGNWDHPNEDSPETLEENNGNWDHPNEDSPETLEGEKHMNSFELSKEPYQTFADREDSSLTDLCDHEIVTGFVKSANSLYEGVVSSCKNLKDTLYNTMVSSCEELLLYIGGRLTLSASMLLIVTFSTRHNLTAAALHDLLQLIELHCPTANNFKGTIKLFKEYFQDVKEPICQHFFCSYCQNLYDKEKPDLCDICGKKEFSSFLSLPIASQLTSIFNALNTKDFSKTRIGSDKIQDVYDGKLYNDHFNKDGFFHGSTEQQYSKELHMSLQVNTDGVAIFKSSNFNIWPLYAVVNELSPSSRYSRENRIFMGLWFGHSKPNMNLFLRPFVKELSDLYSNGFSYQTEQGPKIVRVIVLSAVADAPARCLLLNFTQFNGNFGCPCCYAPGEMHQTSQHGHSRIYPSKEVPVLRTNEETQRVASYVEKEFINGRKAIPVPEYGIKGKSQMAKLPKFNIIRGTTVDYMHCVLLGVMKMLLTLWFDVSHRSQTYSIRKHLVKVNQRLSSIKPPNFLNRIPKNVDDIGQWKASEFRTFLLFFSIPVLNGILPLEYFSNFILLPQAIFLLLQQSIDRSEVDCARNMLRSFCEQIEVLYGARYQTFNVHSLLHLADKVEDLGPLWAHSCFFYEDLNGDLRNLFHGTTNVQKQVMLAVSIQQQIPLLRKSLITQPEAAALYEAMTTRRAVARKENISEGIFVVGRIDNAELSNENLHLVSQRIPNASAFQVFYRVKLHKRVVHSMDYTVVKTRNSYTVLSEDGDLGFVKCYLKCYKNDGEVEYVALVNKLERVHVGECLDNIVHCSVVGKGSNMAVIFIHDIKDVCVCVELAGDNFAFVFKSPNTIERE